MSIKLTAAQRFRAEMVQGQLSDKVIHEIDLCYEVIYLRDLVKELEEKAWAYDQLCK